MIRKLTNQYAISKTLCQRLIPVAETEENFNKKMLLEQDEERAKNYQIVKGYMDRYHKYFIESVLSTLKLDVSEYAQLYFKTNKSEAEEASMEKLEVALRKAISKYLKNDSRYSKLSKKEFIREILPEYLTKKEELEILSQFYDFCTYFTGFFQNRENMYTDEAQPSGIAYRCINDNLPKFLDNVRSFDIVSKNLPEENLDSLENDFSGLFGVNASDVFSVDYFTFVLSQSGIDKYNQIIGGYTTDDGKKIQGLNEYVNLYNQKIAGKDKSLRLPLLKPLFKQILSDRNTVSFIPEVFENDDKLLEAIKKFYLTEEESIEKIAVLFDKLNDYDTAGIHVSGGLSVTDISNKVFGSWNVISDKWNEEYEILHPKKKNTNEEKYDEARRKAYKAIKSFSIASLQNYGENSIADYYSSAVKELCSAITERYKEAEMLLNTPYAGKRLSTDKDATEKIKNLLDSIKELERVIKPLLGSGKEEEKDNSFYGEFLPLFEEISLVDKLYDKTRNYMTKKPYSKDKIKLNFENPQFLGGWDKNKERDYRCVILRKNGSYYLAVMDKSNSKVFLNAPEGVSDDCFEKMDYKLLPGPNKMLPKVFFANSNIDYYAPDGDILRIRAKETFKKGNNFSLSDCHKLIDFYKQSIAKHEDWSKFGFTFSDTSSYSDISEFFNEVKNQGYSVLFRKIDSAYISECVKNGSLYLFRIYNKDFSEYSHGTPNLHTLYFKALFDEKNLSDVVYKLNGESEMFFRKASIERKITHPANKPIENKNPDNSKKTSTFGYDLIKDKRFSETQFSIHIPITLNFKAPGFSMLNDIVKQELHDMDDVHVIGIDRGERNLIYICVINGKGEIVEQCSLNEIISDNGYKVDYHNLLDRKEADRDKARKSWSTVENIKELKEGYISQIVHKICELVVKYDAVIGLEDLNSGFKNSRIKVEKQVYQKFEKMLTDKLNYLVDKKLPEEETGGLYHAYQLTNKADTARHGNQDGIIFYIPAWLTSKIDPTTGFVDLIKAKYASVDAAKEFFSKFDDIRYNAETDMFEFDIDFSKFPKGSTSFKKKWTVCTNSDRIRSFRNPEKNNEWDNETVILTAEFKKLFDKEGIDITSDIYSQIMSQTGADFFKSLCHLFNLTMQMRNSVTGNTDIDYLISPVRNSDGVFYDSRNYENTKNALLPQNADANGAYNIARKVLWSITRIKEADEPRGMKIPSITNKEWLEFAQENE